MLGHLPSVVSRGTAEILIRAPLFLGILVNYLLWGIQIVQSFNYFKSYRKSDARWLKLVVLLLFIVEAAQSASISSSSWNFLVRGSGGLPDDERTIGRGSDILPVLEAFTASIVHIFYAHKIWKLLDSPYRETFTLMVITLSGLQFTGGLGCTVLLYRINMRIAEYLRVRAWACIWLATAAVTDVVITAIMTWKLSSCKTGIKETDDIVSKLIRVIVETGLATAIMQTVHIITYLKFTETTYHMFGTFVGPKVYSNAVLAQVLALLNSRKPRKASTSSNGQQEELEIGSFKVRTQSIRTDDIIGSHQHEKQLSLPVDWTISTPPDQREDV